MKKKVLVIVGPTASGKSDLAVYLAKKFSGEVVSADSRQVYKGLNIGTGKITKREMKGIPHHLLDVVSPRMQFSVSDYKKLADEKVRYIVQIGKLPIVVGGTGFYIDALTGRVNFPDIPPNKLLRNKLGKLNKEKLFLMLEKQEPERAKTIDRHNKVRLIRALEIIRAIGSVPPQLGHSVSKLGFEYVYIGLKPNDLGKRILKRLMTRLSGMIQESRKLHAQGLTYRRMHQLGLEYRYVALYLQGKLTREELTSKLFTEIRRYAKRQMTWFKKNQNIKWFRPEEYKQIERYVRMAL